MDKEKKDREDGLTALETALDLKENKSDTITYNVSVEDNIYVIDGKSQPTLELFTGNTYIFDFNTSLSASGSIDWTTPPDGPIEYMKGVNGVDECLEKLPLKNTNDFVQFPDIINKHNRLFHRFPPSISFVDRQLYFVSFQKYNSNSEYKILQSKLNTANDIINYSNGTFGVWEKITIVEKENGFYSLKNANNKYIRNLQDFNTNKGGSLDLNVINNDDGTFSLFVVNENKYLTIDGKTIPLGVSETPGDGQKFFMYIADDVSNTHLENVYPNGSNQEKLQTWIRSTDLYITQQGTKASSTSIFSDIDDNSVDQFIENLLTKVSENSINRNFVILLLQQMAALYDVCSYEYRQLSNQTVMDPITGSSENQYQYDTLEEAQQQCNIMDTCTGITKDDAGYHLRSGVPADYAGSTSWQKEKVCKIETTIRDIQNIFDPFSVASYPIVKFSTTPDGPIEYTEGVTTTEIFGKVEVESTFSDLLFNGVKDSLENLPLKSIDNVEIPLPTAYTTNKQIYHRFTSSLSFENREFYFISFKKFKSNSEYKILQVDTFKSGIGHSIGYSNGFFGTWEKITIVEKENGYYTLKNADNLYIDSLKTFDNNAGSLDLNVINNDDGTFSLFVVNENKYLTIDGTTIPLRVSETLGDEQKFFMFFVDDVSNTHLANVYPVGSNQEKLQTWIRSTDLYVKNQGTEASEIERFSDIDDNSVEQFIENLFTAVSENTIDKNLTILLLQQMADLEVYTEKIESTMQDTYNISETEKTEIQTRYANDPDSFTKVLVDGISQVRTEIKVDLTTPTTLHYYSEQQSGMGGRLNIHALLQKANQTDLDLKENKSETISYTVSVEDNKYLIDGESQATLDLFNKNIYIFDFDTSSSKSASDSIVKFSTTPDGPIEYTEGVTTTETSGKVAVEVFSDLLSDGVRAILLSKIPLRQNYPPNPEGYNYAKSIPTTLRSEFMQPYRKLTNRLISSIEYLNREVFIVPWKHWYERRNKQIRYILRSMPPQTRGRIVYSNTFGTQERFTFVQKKNGHITLKNSDGKYMTNLEYFDSDEEGSLNLLIPDQEENSLFFLQLADDPKRNDIVIDGETLPLRTVRENELDFTTRKELSSFFLLFADNVSNSYESEYYPDGSNRKILQTWIRSTDLYSRNQAVRGTDALYTDDMQREYSIIQIPKLDTNSLEEFVDALFTAVSENTIDRTLAILLLRQMADLGFYREEIENRMRFTHNISETEKTEIQTRYANDPDNFTKFLVDGISRVKTEIKIGPTTPTTLYYYSGQQEGMGGRLNIHTLSQKANQTDVTTELDKKANQTDVTTEFDKKADKTDVNTQLALKANNTDMIKALNLKINKSDFPNISNSSKSVTINTRLNLYADAVIGTSAGSPATIYMSGGSSGDANYQYTMIQSRQWGNADQSELLLYKGNDRSPYKNMDRIRLKAGHVVIDPENSTNPASGNIKFTFDRSGLYLGNLSSPGMQFKTDGSHDRFQIFRYEGGRNSKNNYFYYNRNNRYGTTSDRRLKENIEDLEEEDMEFLMKIRPRKYKLKGEESACCNYGMIAQEIVDIIETDPQKVIINHYDEYIADPDTEEMLGISYDSFIPLLIKKVQMQDTKIKTLEKEIEEIKAKLA